MLTMAMLPPPRHLFFFFYGPTYTPQHHNYSSTLIYSPRLPVPPSPRMPVNVFWLAQPVTMATAQPPLLRHPSYLHLPHGFFHQQHHDHCTYSLTCRQKAVEGGTRAKHGWTTRKEMSVKWGKRERTWGREMTKEHVRGCEKEINVNCWIEKEWWWWTEEKEEHEAIPHLPSS